MEICSEGQPRSYTTYEVINQYSYIHDETFDSLICLLTTVAVVLGCGVMPQGQGTRPRQRADDGNVPLFVELRTKKPLQIMNIIMANWSKDV
ncbi:hypothetical protein KIN20_017783 [Parelaphostrongylus tenuis]|uniref:Uncharacterized protein n=1 Tax=Parelaphostrongylus tenuis TaxID=148309 RepID=A0AAD5MID1_PARTN|nr:hypothetical protein KIN20_017783 [Parelaphostrongylus tenuis]